MLIADRLARVREALEEVCAREGRDPGEVGLVAVCKRVGAERVLAAAAAGQVDFGENRVQEAEPKIERCAGRGLRWHMVGQLQSNKAVRAARLFDLVHSLDSAKVARVLSRTACEQGFERSVLIQVKLGGGPTRGGVEIECVAELAEQVAALPGLSLRGLMGVAPLDAPARPAFARLRRTFEDLRARPPAGACIEVLSAGMSQDFVEAVREGATLVRIGTAIFGD